MNDKNEYFNIVKKFLLETIKKRKHNPFFFRDLEDLTFCDIPYNSTKEETQKIKIQHKKLQTEIKKYHNYIHWFVNENNLHKNKFLDQIEYFRFYTYAIIWNKILNDDSMKKKNGDYISERNPNYEENILKLLNKYKYIELNEFLENEEPMYSTNNKHKYLQDLEGNYILPRIEEDYNINSFYNLSRNLLK
jgi:hypothetical protein